MLLLKESTSLNMIYQIPIHYILILQKRLSNLNPKRSLNCHEKYTRGTSHDWGIIAAICEPEVPTAYLKIPPFENSIPLC